MKYSLSKSSSKLTKAGQANYLAHIKPEGNYTEEDLSVDLASVLGGGAAQVWYYEQRREQAIQAALKAGKTVRIGGVQLMPVLRGGFASIDGAFDAERNAMAVTAYSYGELKDCLASVVPTNVEAAASPTLSHIREEGTEKEELLVTGGEVTITGRNLKVDTSAADEGVALADVRTGAEKAQAEVALSNFDSLVCSFAQLPTDGRYLLVVKTRSGLDREHAVARATREITVKRGA